MGFAEIFKANPYHDERGWFTTKDKATFVSIGGIFDKQRALAASRASASRASRTSEVEAFVDFSAPIKRLERLNERIRQRNELYKDVPGIDPTPEIVIPSGNSLGPLKDVDIREAFSPEKTSVYMALKMGVIKKILEGDEFKNSLQTGKGTFKLAGKDRVEKEKEILGVKADPSEPEKFPKYGFVAKKGKMDFDNIVGFGYGDVYVEFHDSVRKNTTATVGDSINNNNGPVFRLPAPIDNMTSKQFASGLGWLDSQFAKNAEKYSKTGNFYDLIVGAEYVEAQIYGRLDRSHIKAIHVESASAAKKLSSLLKKHGLKIEVKPTGTHTTLKLLSEGDSSEWERVSPKDLENLGDSYVEVGWGATASVLWGKNWEGKRDSFNLPKTLKAIRDYPDPKKVPMSVKREVMAEYLAESQKGKASSLPKVFQVNGARNVGFTEDVFNKELLKEYKR